MRTKVLISLFCILFATSCMEYFDSEVAPKNMSCREISGALTKSTSLILAQKVSVSDVEDYLQYRLNIDKFTIQDILKYDINDSSFVYFVQLNNDHWFLFSGDYSYMPIIASGEDKLFIDSLPDNHFRDWMQTIGFQMEESGRDYSKAINRNKNEWLRCKRIAERERRKRGRSNEDDSDTSDIAIDIEIEYLIDEYYPPLTLTKWDQGYPFNLALPLFPPYGDTDRCLAGCAVTAVSQLLYYTHFAFGYPNDIFAEASCSQHYNQPGTPPYTYSFSSPSTTCWNLMGLTVPTNYNSSYAPALFALVASRSNTDYTDGQGCTSSNAICSTLSSFLLTGASETSYSRQAVVSQIENDKPVLCAGASSSSSTTGHLFIIDGYRWLKFREVETISDLQGNILEVNINVHEDFGLHINSGNISPSYHFWVYNDSYYPYNRKVYIGW